MDAEKLVSDGSPAMEEVIAIYLQGRPCSVCHIPIDGGCHRCGTCKEIVCGSCQCVCSDPDASEIRELEEEIEELEEELEEAQDEVYRIEDDLWRSRKRLRELKGEK